MTAISSPRRPRTTSIKSRREAAAREESSAITLTPDGRLLMTERLRHLREAALPALVPLLVDRERDERDTAEFERLTAEADWLEHLLATSLTASPGAGAEVRLGSRVLLRLAGGVEEWVRPVHPVEAFLDEERISATSPLSQAILGASVGQSVTVHGPSATWRCRIVEVRTVAGREHGPQADTQPAARAPERAAFEPGRLGGWGCPLARRAQSARQYERARTALASIACAPGRD